MCSVLKLEGCGTALVTPFLADGSVDYDAYAACVDRQVKAGVDFLVPLATTGETPTLSSEEKIRLLSITREHSGGLPLLVGCGTNSLTGTLANMELLRPYGADAWLVVVPYYNKPTQEGQFQYFKAIAEKSDLPIVVYNVPGRTGANMMAETAVRIAFECPNVIATKEASGKSEQVSDIIKCAPEGFSVLSGDDDMTVAFMKAGAKGVISVASNIAPAEVSAMVHAALKGDWDTADSMDEELRPLFKACFVESNPIPVKEAMAQMGLIGRTMRLPLVSASKETADIMAATLKSLL